MPTGVHPQSHPQVTAEGGCDAAREVDALYRSLEALERRARAWAERRQQLLLDAADPIAAGKLPSAQEAGAAAAAVVAAVCCIDGWSAILCMTVLCASMSQQGTCIHICAQVSAAPVAAAPEEDEDFPALRTCTEPPFVPEHHHDAPQHSVARWQGHLPTKTPRPRVWPFVAGPGGLGRLRDPGPLRADQGPCVLAVPGVSVVGAPCHCDASLHLVLLPQGVLPVPPTRCSVATCCFTRRTTGNGRFSTRSTCAC